MARSQQDPEVKRLRKEAKKELRRETYKTTVAWLNQEWKGSHWLPKHLGDVSEMLSTRTLPLGTLGSTWSSNTLNLLV
ncbi:hypothetical protein LB505_011468 [Fusarium chuoi]|nr:hypothetical protein LB505_011468 [Fusarium chuoi]